MHDDFEIAAGGGVDRFGEGLGVLGVVVRIGVSRRHVPFLRVGGGGGGDAKRERGGDFFERHFVLLVRK